MGVGEVRFRWTFFTCVDIFEENRVFDWKNIHLIEITHFLIIDMHVLNQLVFILISYYICDRVKNCQTLSTMNINTKRDFNM